MRAAGMQPGRVAQLVVDPPRPLSVHFEMGAQGLTVVLRLGNGDEGGLEVELSFPLVGHAPE